MTAFLMPDRRGSCHTRSRRRMSAAEPLPAAIISLAAADVAEAGAPIEPARRHIALVHFEKDRARAEPREPAQMEIEQPPRQTLPAPG